MIVRLAEPAGVRAVVMYISEVSKVSPNSRSRPRKDDNFPRSIFADRGEPMYKRQSIMIVVKAGALAWHEIRRVTVNTD